MGRFPISRFFRLCGDGVRCDERRLFIGSAPMLEHSARPGGSEGASSGGGVDPLSRSTLQPPVDASAKQGGLAVVARAVERNDLALA